MVRRSAGRAKRQAARPVLNGFDGDSRDSEYRIRRTSVFGASRDLAATEFKNFGAWEGNTEFGDRGVGNYVKNGPELII